MVNPGDAGNPLQGLLGDLMRAIGGGAMGPGGASGTTAPWWEAARALAQSVAAEGATQDRVDPLDRIALGELVRVAELHVSEATGLSGGGRTPEIVRGARPEWAVRALDAWRPALERMVAAQATTPLDLGGLGTSGGLGDLGDLGVLGDLGGLGGGEGGLAHLLGQFASTMGPLLLGLQFGSAAGHLARSALGQSVVPIPWMGAKDIAVAAENVTTFASDWSLPIDETRLWVCVRELAARRVLDRGHVSSRLDELLAAAAAEMTAVQEGLADRLRGAEGAPPSMEQMLGDPESLLADLVTPANRYRSAQLTALTTVIGAYVDHVTAGIAASLTSASGRLGEAWYRYRVEDSQGEAAAAALFGLDLGATEVDRGRAFVEGVVERAGPEGLARLWGSARTLPTPAEVDAPGLWLERIDLPDPELGGPASETTD